MRLPGAFRSPFAVSWLPSVRRLARGGWQVLRCLLVIVPALVLGGCSLLIAKHGTRPIRSLNTRSHRADVVAELGAPRHSVTFSPPVEAPYNGSPGQGKAVRRDEYEISGLRLAPGDCIGNQSQWDWYPLGADEFTLLPATAREWAQRAGQRDRLLVWFSRDERVVSWDVESVRYPPEPERPFGWAVRLPDHQPPHGSN